MMGIMPLKAKEWSLLDRRTPKPIMVWKNVVTYNSTFKVATENHIDSIFVEVGGPILDRTILVFNVAKLEKFRDADYHRSTNDISWKERQC